MDIFVVRGNSEDTGTPGKLNVTNPDNVEFKCDTLELPWRGNKNGISCILADTYTCDLWESPHLGRTVLRLEDKHNRQACLVHNGNFAGDVGEGLFTQIHGCTEVGRGYADIALPSGKGKQFGVCASKATLEQLIDFLGEGPHTITYTWAEGCTPDDYPGDAA